MPHPPYSKYNTQILRIVVSVRIFTRNEKQTLQMLGE